MIMHGLRNPKFMTYTWHEIVALLECDAAFIGFGGKNLRGSRTARILKMGSINYPETMVTNNQRCITSQKNEELV
jgi:hypothetical protein